MPTASGHTTAIRASRVVGTNVYNAEGDKIGEVEDVILDKLSNDIMFAVVGFGGFLGMDEKYHPLPWALLDYEESKDGYVVNLTKAQLEKAPADAISDLTRDDGKAARSASYSYYGIAPHW